MTTKETKLMTIDEAAKMLNVKASWMRGAVFKKEIPYIKLGHHVRFEEKSLKDWVDGKRVAHS